MALLFFWRGDYYPKNIKYVKGYELNQNNELMNKIYKGEHIWAFTRRDDKTYVLALDLYAINKKINSSQSPSRKFGKYKVEGDKSKSRYFKIEKGPSITKTIRSLHITAKAKILGHSFRGLNAVRKIDDSDEQVLVKFAANLPTI
jgi:hypothetical protein